MKNRVVRAAATVLAVSGVLLSAACTSDPESEPAATPTQTQEEQGQEEGVSGTVTVPDVTVLILETAQGNLERAGLEVEVVDESGAAVATDDATAWVVTDQDPADGTVERGTLVTLTVAAR
ncbi:PASTA domain-containing protein [Actinotalea sp. K2]|uniref:PASTA domain-containing protein n=1 Tax=Actinotalea sp. K2 TaxID=2939438 RepID=UPI002017CFC1|nr:PASTA domain-containing protein [Actinotalea sp. K2]MCL3861922.1 PASTA domain-containing protein [Actinotalea sp. K2]